MATEAIAVSDVLTILKMAKSRDSVTKEQVVAEFAKKVAAPAWDALPAGRRGYVLGTQGLPWSAGSDDDWAKLDTDLQKELTDRVEVWA